MGVPKVSGGGTKNVPHLVTGEQSTTLSLFANVHVTDRLSRLWLVHSGK